MWQQNAAGAATANDMAAWVVRTGREYIKGEQFSLQF